VCVCVCVVQARSSCLQKTLVTDYINQFQFSSLTITLIDYWWNFGPFLTQSFMDSKVIWTTFMVIVCLFYVT